MRCGHGRYTSQLFYLINYVPFLRTDTYTVSSVELYYLFKEPKYNLASFLSTEILEVGENIFQANREDYVSKVKNLYKKHDIHPGQKPEEIVDMQLRAGVHLESWFEGFVHTFEDKSNMHFYLAL